MLEENREKTLKTETTQASVTNSRFFGKFEPIFVRGVFKKTDDNTMFLVVQQLAVQ